MKKLRKIKEIKDVKEINKGGLHMKWWNQYRNKLLWIKEWKKIPTKIETKVWGVLTNEIMTLNYMKFVCKIKVSSLLCRLCHKTNESISHILGSCEAMRLSDTMKKHDRTLKPLVYHLFEKYKFDIHVNKNPNNRYENNEAIINWNIRMIMEQKVQKNFPDIVVIDKNQKKIFIIDVTVPFDDNLDFREKDKVNKYGELKIQLLTQNKGYTGYIIPVAIGALGTVTNKFDEYLSLLIPDRKERNKLRKRLVEQAISSTAVTISKWSIRIKQLSK